MKVIDKNELKIIKQFSCGTFSHIFEVYYQGNKYCYKQFRKDYPDDIVKNICKLTEEEFDKDFITPLMMVLDKGKIVGYISYLKENALESEEVFNMKNQKYLLMKSKLLIQRLHFEYNRIHCDINYANVLYDEKNKGVFLIDFDSSLKIGQPFQSKTCFPNYLIEYLKYYQLDKLVDIYEFNLLTLILLARKNQKIILNEIGEDIFPKEIKSEKAKKLCKELTLRDTRKKLSGEFIIDYI